MKKQTANVVSKEVRGGYIKNQGPLDFNPGYQNIRVT